MQTDTIQRALEGAIHKMYRSETNGSRRMRQWFTFRFELMKRRVRDEIRIRDLERQVTQLQAENAMLREDIETNSQPVNVYGELPW